MGGILGAMNGVGPIAITSVTEPAHPPVDRAIAALAAQQHGVVALRQLVALGLSAPAARARVREGRLHPVHRGVYAVGHELLTGRARGMAAVLACGPGAVLSHRSAADLHGLRESARASHDVTSPRRAGRSRPGIDVHRAAGIAGHMTTVDGIPCTSVARTLLDLAEVVGPHAVQKALERAEILQVLDVRALYEVTSQASGRRAAPRLMAALMRYDPRLTLTRYELERLFLAMCDAAGIPRPKVNSWLELAPGDWIQPDFLWQPDRLIVETDGFETHGTRAAFERDRRRDQRTLVAGYRTLRSTWRQVIDTPADVAGAIVSLLPATPRSGARSPRPRPPAGSATRSR
jgi:predicted transcriptional regulator of viral defense system